MTRHGIGPIVICFYVTVICGIAYAEQPKNRASFQSRSSKTGLLFEKICRHKLLSLGFRLQGPRKITKAGIQVDEVALNSRGQEIFFEFKGSYRSPRPGLVRTDTTKKALCNGFLMDLLGIGPYIIMTSHMPRPGSSSDKMIKLAQQVIYDIVVISDQDDMLRLQGYLKALPSKSKKEHGKQ